MKKYKYLIAAAAVIAVLAAAFFAGGSLDGGQTPDAGEQQTEVSAGGAAADQPAAQSPAAQEPQPPAVPSPEPEQTPRPEEKQEPQPSDPVPAAPEDGQTTEDGQTPEEQPLTCTISISCAALLEHMEKMDPEKTDLVPEDGWLLPPVSVEFQAGESVFDVLQRVCREQKLHMEFSNTPVYNSAYIEGIGNLYEFDCGALSGWMYCVNEWFPNYGCSSYVLSDGDVIRWVYTCDLGADVGNGSMAGE